MSNSGGSSSNTLFALLNPTNDDAPATTSQPSNAQAPYSASPRSQPLSPSLSQNHGYYAPQPQPPPQRASSSPSIASLLSQEDMPPSRSNTASQTPTHKSNGDQPSGQVAVASLLSPLPASAIPTEVPPTSPAPPAAATPFKASAASTSSDTASVATLPTPATKKPKNSGSSSGALLQLGIGSPGGAQHGNSDDAPTVCLHVPLNGKTNVVVNFAKLAEDKYGWESLHPRIASTAAELFDEDGADAEDSEDSGGDDDEKPEAAGDESGNAASTTKKPAKRRRTDGKYGRYDINDPFIDDSELLFEEQAASTKDGFFVFSGPLIADQDQVRIERADGTIKRPGRGRGGRGGGTGRGGKRAAAAAASAAATVEASQSSPVAIAPAPGGQTLAPAAPVVPRKKKGASGAVAAGTSQSPAGPPATTS
ncbi:hypothetical protein V1520DRAFT_333020 [Lipomyces starkeyi]|uniref:Hpc2-related domain-containing protein n=1 Tax=Lipomyces starkeyi NRRL Y-11557 TaxID=675824 RepID=A0A1E3Q5P6_LIPST|nr:hypothetical protein LIPSTDRAFT_63274 [Lipomyces starkeyi NRRL Y-11557]